MGFTNIFKIFFKNYSLVIKVLLAQVIMIVAGVGILALSVSGLVSDIGAQLEVSELSTAANEILQEIGSKDFSAQKMVRLLGEFVIVFQEWGTTINLFYYKLSLYSVVFFFWLIVVRFLIGLGNLPLNENLNEYLCSSYKSPFFWHYFKGFDKSCKQQLVGLLAEFVADIIIVFAALGIYIVVFVYTGIWGLVLALLFYSVLASFRRTATAFWLPEMVNDNDRKPKQSLRRGIQAVVPVFGRVYWKTLVVFTVTFALVLGVLLIFGFNLFTVTLCLVIFAHNNIFQSHISMAEYYKATGKTFYVTRV